MDLRRRLGIALVLVSAPPAPLWATISGHVRAAGNGTPISDARVHLQTKAQPFAISGADGSYSLAVNPTGIVVVTANLAYDRTAAVNYTTNGTQARNGATDADIQFEPVPVVENATYVPIKAATPNGCGDCHTEQRLAWAASVHAGAAIDTWVLDLYSGTGTPGGSAGYVYRATHDPGETGFCATCHAPVAEAHAPGTVFFNDVTETSALEGVNCSACHSIDSVSEDVEKIHLLGNATNRFPLAGVNGAATHDFVWGPLDDVSYPFMKASYAPVFSQSRFCASCHEYVNPDTGAPGQQTYSEWLASPYAVAGPTFRSCQDCHMPEQSAPAELCDPPPAFSGVPVLRPGSQNHSHSFVGATEPMLRTAIQLTASAVAAAGAVEVMATVSNVGAGHAFPSGVSIRNALLVVSVQAEGVPLVQFAGPTVPDWADDDVPGKQEGDYAGEPGKGFAKILEGRIDGQGPVVSPVLFIDADRAASHTEIPSGVAETTTLRFAVPVGAKAGDAVQMSARLLYRRAFRALAVTKGWTTTPQGGAVEIEVARVEADVVLDGGALAPTVTPTMSATPTPTPRASADANCDGGVTGADLAALLRELLGSPSTCNAGDANQNGKLDTGDITAIIETLFGGK